MDRDLLLRDLVADEGYRPLLYDDATGKQWRQGDQIKGWPTIAIGWNVASTPISLDRARVILGWMVDDKLGPLNAALPWLSGLSEPRQRAVANMAYNLGVTSLLKFDTFLSLLKSGQYEAAADDLETTAWWKQVGQRGPRIQALIRGA